MKEKTFLLLSLFLFLLGTLLIYFSSIYSENSVIKIGSITKSLIGKKVCITGKISYIKSTKVGIFTRIKDESGEIFVPIFSTLSRFFKNELERGKKVMICGVVDEYKGNLEIKPFSLNDIKIIK